MIADEFDSCDDALCTCGDCEGETLTPLEAALEMAASIIVFLFAAVVVFLFARVLVEGVGL